MTHFCTVADKNYLLKGLALYKSLLSTCNGDFTLHWLCMDHYTYQQLQHIKKTLPDFKNIRAYSLLEMEYAYVELREAKKNPPCRYGTQYSQYCWCLAPWFTNYILYRIRKESYLMYVDSDLFFYNDPSIITDIVFPDSAGIHTHRFTGPFTDQINGWYNVGVVAFKHDMIGTIISDTWKEWLLNPKNPYYEKYGTCGDQKYLEKLKELYSADIVIFDERGDILHYGPWCTHNPKNQQPLFFHFSHFTYDINGNTWSDSINGEWNPAKEPNMKPYYENYFETIRQLSTLINPSL